MFNLSTTKFQFLYDVTRKYFVIVAGVIMLATLIIDAPFGRFTISRPNTRLKRWWAKLSIDGRLSWFLMEIVSPVTFVYTFFSAPFAPPSTSSTLSQTLAQYSGQQWLLFVCYMVHYTNRAIISPYRAPSRSRAHVVVLLFGWAFNSPNGFLMGAWLSSPQTREWLQTAQSTKTYWAGIAIWIAGFVGNVVHDEILANLRRNVKVSPPTASNGHGNGQKKEKDEKPAGEHYAIPHGLLFEYVTFPNYFCEWVEWYGWAIAASPKPRIITSIPAIFIRFLSRPSILFPAIKGFLLAHPATFAPTLTPPWIFLLNEVVLMLPRAWRGHMWYHSKFGDDYPKDRKVVVPFLF